MMVSQDPGAWGRQTVKNRKIMTFTKANAVERIKVKASKPLQTYMTNLSNKLVAPAPLTTHQYMNQLSSIGEEDASEDILSNQRQLGQRSRKKSNRMTDDQLIQFAGQQLKMVSCNLKAASVRNLKEIITKAFSQTEGNPMRLEMAIDKFGKHFIMKRSRKLFSIYRSRQLQGGTQNESNNPSTKYFTSMHYYKRDLSPLKENFAACNEKTPYRDNFQDYEGSLLSKGFKDELLLSLGQGVRCITQSSTLTPLPEKKSASQSLSVQNGHQSSRANRTIQTFVIESDFKSLRSYSSKAVATSPLLESQKPLKVAPQKEISPQRSVLEPSSTTASRKEPKNWIQKLKIRRHQDANPRRVIETENTYELSPMTMSAVNLPLDTSTTPADAYLGEPPQEFMLSPSPQIAPIRVKRIQPSEAGGSTQVIKFNQIRKSIPIPADHTIMTTKNAEFQRLSSNLNEGPFATEEECKEFDDKQALIFRTQNNHLIQSHSRQDMMNKKYKSVGGDGDSTPEKQQEIVSPIQPRNASVLKKTLFDHTQYTSMHKKLSLFQCIQIEHLPDLGDIQYKFMAVTLQESKETLQQREDKYSPEKRSRSTNKHSVIDNPLKSERDSQQQRRAQAMNSSGPVEFHQEDESAYGMRGATNQSPLVLTRSDIKMPLQGEVQQMKAQLIRIKNNAQLNGRLREQQLKERRRSRGTIYDDAYQDYQSLPPPNKTKNAQALQVMISTPNQPVILSLQQSDSKKNKQHQCCYKFKKYRFTSRAYIKTGSRGGLQPLFTLIILQIKFQLQLLNAFQNSD